jgi:hypothetical protein
MAFVEEVARADAAITEATFVLLSLPSTIRRRSTLCLIKSMFAHPYHPHPFSVYF